MAKHWCGPSRDMAAHENRKAALPGVLTHSPQQGGQVPKREAGREGNSLEMPQLRICRSAK